MGEKMTGKGVEQYKRFKTRTRGAEGWGCDKPNGKHHRHHFRRMCWRIWPQQMLSEIEPHSVTCMSGVGGGGTQVSICTCMCVPVCVWCRTRSIRLYHHLPHSSKAQYLGKPWSLLFFFLAGLAGQWTPEIPCLQISRAAITGSLCCAWPFTWVLGTWTWIFILVQEELLAPELSPSSPVPLKSFVCLFGFQ